MRRRRGRDPVNITTASRPHSEDIRGRERRYVVSMGIRTVCFLLVLVTRGHWYVWVFLVAALVLPYIAVVMANAGSSADPAGVDNSYDPTRKALGTTPVDPLP